MHYTDYQRKKTKSAIEYDVYEKKIKRKTSEL